jgi:hypothetical protein
MTDGFDQAPLRPPPEDTAWLEGTEWRRDGPGLGAVYGPFFLGLALLAVLLGAVMR